MRVRGWSSLVFGKVEMIENDHFSITKNDPAKLRMPLCTAYASAHFKRLKSKKVFSPLLFIRV